ncbi:MAG: GTP-binding protein [Desulfatibacillaceae bacterium]
MAEIDTTRKLLVVKIVYYGPALSGKTTNLMGLHDLLNPHGRGDLMTLETKGDRTLFFDLLPLLTTSESQWNTKIKLYTVPGQVAHDATRKAVLSRADGVVFVADSQREQAMNNFVSFDNLEKNAARVGLDVDSLPLAIQFNKRDLEDVIPEQEVILRWEPTGLPILFASALYNRGVRDTFERILRDTYADLDVRHRLSGRFGITVDDFLSTLAKDRVA